MAHHKSKDYNGLGIPKPKCSSRQSNHENSLHSTPIGLRNSMGSMSLFTDAKVSKSKINTGTKKEKKLSVRSNKGKKQSKSSLKKSRSKTKSMCAEESEIPKDFKLL